MKSPLRITLKLSWMTVMLILLSLFAKGTVDFVYTGF